MTSSSELFWLDLGSGGDSSGTDGIKLDGMAGSPAIPQYRSSFMSLFMKPSLPIFQAEVFVEDWRGLTKFTHSQTRGSEQ